MKLLNLSFQTSRRFLNTFNKLSTNFFTVFSILAKLKSVNFVRVTEGALDESVWVDFHDTDWSFGFGSTLNCFSLGSGGGDRFYVEIQKFGVFKAGR
jgi:hypothetical protein